jgi:hypothetical protein
MSPGFSSSVEWRGDGHSGPTAFSPRSMVRLVPSDARSTLFIRCGSWGSRSARARTRRMRDCGRQVHRHRGNDRSTTRGDGRAIRGPRITDSSRTCRWVRFPVHRHRRAGAQRRSRPLAAIRCGVGLTPPKRRADQESLREDRHPMTRGFAELLVGCEEDRTLRAVLADAGARRLTVVQDLGEPSVDAPRAGVY